MNCDYEYYYYKVSVNEHLLDIAKKQRVIPWELKKINKEIDFNDLSKDMIIKIPSNSCCCINGSFHRIRYGQSIFNLSRKYDISVENIITANPFFDINTYIEGQVIIIPHKSFFVHEKKFYIIREGEDIVQISKKFDLKPTELIELNPHLAPLEFTEGVKIKIH